MKLWIVEKRTPAGGLDFSEPQPEKLLGFRAITGLTEDDLAKRVWQHAPDAVLDGRYIASWPTFVNPQFVARRKTW